MKKTTLFKSWCLSLLVIIFTFASCSKSKMYKAGDTLTTTEQTVGTVTESDFDEMLRISNAKDGAAFSTLILLGRMYVIESGTQCRVIETNVGRIKCHVSIAGISHELWINSKFLK